MPPNPPPTPESTTAATTRAEAVERVARSMVAAAGLHTDWDDAEQWFGGFGRDMRKGWRDQARAALDAMGYDELLAENARLREVESSARRLIHWLTRTPNTSQKAIQAGIEELSAALETFHLVGKVVAVNGNLVEMKDAGTSTPNGSEMIVLQPGWATSRSGSWSVKNGKARGRIVGYPAMNPIPVISERSAPSTIGGTAICDVTTDVNGALDDE
jgi:hypothetical protein